MAAAPPGQLAETPGSPAPPPSAAKPIHSLILDTGPLIKNDPTVSVLLSKAEKLYTLPVIISEIRDTATRSRVETTLLPFVTLRSPKPESVRFVSDFAKKTGDYSVLSRPDLEVLALGYEIECERNGGDWRLRRTPGQDGLNGKPPTQQSEPLPEAAGQPESPEAAVAAGMDKLQVVGSVAAGAQTEEEAAEPESADSKEEFQACNDEQIAPTPGEDASLQDDYDNDDDDDEGWITPSNLKKHQNKDSGSAGTKQTLQQTLQAAVLTSDYAMQNVALRINLNLIAPSFARITHLKNWVFRCHGCFAICKDMNKQFCPKCGQPTLTRVSCSTDEHGKFTIHLKQNFQWNTRGNVYSVPKPVHGSSNGRLPKNVGGKNNWGKDLILAEDQKEYVKQQDEQRRQQKNDLMDEDFLPGLLGRNRHGAGGKIRVGAGRTVNARRKR
ncbi:20S-pre-rRNA D-site endonuclease nob1 [Escovopsis weberi]|uniref:20S-pre-rRNA D-site endonuclease NOB1 n=1 Tax=Escovopsis weberi TaxID=150374 RepID=A0A0M8MZT9_ESCWE|nr:20S-pre-rRNA D-site endonuclease nob1 [Escovopsis weberi]